MGLHRRAGACSRHNERLESKKAAGVKPRQIFKKSVGVISLFSAYQIFALSDSRGRLSLQNRCKLPYEKRPLPVAFYYPAEWAVFILQSIRISQARIFPYRKDSAQRHREAQWGRTKEARFGNTDAFYLQV